MQLVLDSIGLSLKKRNDCFQVIHKEESRLISPKRVSSIAITKACLLSSEAIKLAVRHEIPLFLMDKYGQVEGCFWSPKYKKLSKIRRRQLQLPYCQMGTEWILRLLHLKTKHQTANLNYLKNRRPSQEIDIEKSIQKIWSYHEKVTAFESKKPIDCRSEIMGIEGIIARTYWRQISNCLPERYAFEKRSYRPALDIFNTTLNYLYGILYVVVDSAVLSAGFDNQGGIAHADTYNRPTFVYDVIEPFRPWVDRLLIDICLQKELKQSHIFKQDEKGWWLNHEGKELIFTAFNKYRNRRKYFNNLRLSVEHHIYHFLGELSQELKNSPDHLFHV